MTSMDLPLLYLGESSFNFSETRSPMPPSFLWPKASVVSSSKTISPPSNMAPSETMTGEYRLGFFPRSAPRTSVSRSLLHFSSGTPQRLAAPPLLRCTPLQPPHHP